ncbi:MAG: hypothetical protein LBH36_02440 [Candidatus Nomurabacteria bacterium]|jgi:hypothetical protein|nr:hypothetical protein [Candidatus Nomurabacteria bacterium]
MTKKQKKNKFDPTTTHFFWGVFTGFAVAGVCALTFARVIPYLSFAAEWSVVASYNAEGVCDTLSPECGICGYGDDARSYKLVGSKCYVKKN